MYFMNKIMILKNSEDIIDEDEDDFTGVAPVDRYDDFSVFGKYFGIYADWAFDGYF